MEIQNYSLLYLLIKLMCGIVGYVGNKQVVPYLQSVCKIEVLR